VGATGSGKSTIISLIARFYEPQQGRIFVDGIELRQATVESLHEQIGIVTQENFLFTGTILENLKFAALAPDEEVIQVIKTLGTHETILRQEKGYETSVAERFKLQRGRAATDLFYSGTGAALEFSYSTKPRAQLILKPRVSFSTP
jgi:ABC-type multidrug transport system fused ATPase/permease subunit